MTEAAAPVPVEKVDDAVKAAPETSETVEKTNGEASSEAKGANGTTPANTEEVEKACKKQGE